jgi:hypothetical protein
MRKPWSWRAEEAETAAVLADRTQTEETAMLRGVSAPVRFVRIGGYSNHVPHVPSGVKKDATFQGPAPG